MPIQWPRPDRKQVLRTCWLTMAFFLLLLGAFLFLRYAYLSEYTTEGMTLSMGVYTVGGGVLLATLGTLFVRACMPSVQATPRSVWACPLAAAGLSLAVMALAYSFLGVYPVGDKSILIVDMHHQYAPLLSELRHMLLEGKGFTYSFHIGLGANFISCFAYYLASPLNLLLLLFAESRLAEGILFITLLKNALCAAAFAACVQYLTRKRNATTVAVSVLYSLMVYMLAYSWNIMWLDGVILLPVVVLCFERMMREGKWLGYVLTLALALFCNYYIGFMLCVFLVLYFAVWQLRSPRSLAERARGVGYFAGGSLLGGGLAMALLVPTALALGRTSAAGDAFPSFAATFDFFDLVGRFYYGATPTIRSGNLPNVYCGVLAVLLVPVYATQKSIPLRRRLSYGALLAVLLVSCTINQWDLVWHGLHTPNDLPYRFSFLVCFVLLLMVARVLAQLTQITPKQILGSLTASAVYLVLWEKFGGESAPEDTLLYINILLLLLYAAVLLVGVTRRLPVRAGRLLLLAAVSVELLLGTGRTLLTMNENEHFTLRDSYVANYSTAANAQAVKKAQQIAQEKGDLFARIEYLPRSTCMDTALHHYEGITTFASSNPYTTTRFMGDLGYAINGVNSYLYHSFVAPCDSLLGVKYVILNVRLSAHKQLKLLDTVAVGDQTRYIYENTAALPVGYFATADIEGYEGVDYAPFDNQEALYTAIRGEATDIYSPLEFATEQEGAYIFDTGSFSLDGTVGTAYYEGAIVEEGQYFGFVDCRAAETIRVTTLKEDGSEKNSWGVTTHEPYIIDLGNLKPGEQVEVSITADSAVSGNIHIARLDTAAFDAAVADVAAGGLTVTERTATGLTGTVTAPQDGMLLLSIPYDAGWRATVDGDAAEVIAIDHSESEEDGALLAVKLPAGAHTVTLSYRAPGQLLGLLMSIVSAAAAVALWLFERAWHKKHPVVQVS